MLEQWIRWIHQDPATWIMGVLIGQVVLFLLLLIGWIRFSLQKRRWRKLYRYFQHADSISALLESGKVDGEQLLFYLKRIDQTLASLKGRMGLVRYNAMGESATDMSFSLAMLDEQGNGVVISSLFSHHNPSYIYAKPIVEGESSYPLSSEERQAIHRALNGNKEEDTAVLTGKKVNDGK
ncbi:DUF4446 family protein [Polycladomyces sp. WAk]|uniref:DUF4446 family protein n=1 Tax=Polycladomyces zharkentensis TaxID=2807616 RepID=A0ABS2WF52_9BACL|nr:DUF4446 family protein [Polycladomyces sp. WAk]MBN2908163.1 DUF4446 family protein [Polycladomyces sp. WAk]